MWQSIKDAHTSMLKFGHGHMIAYFIDRKAHDNLPSSDVKSLSVNAYRMSEAGHIQQLRIASDKEFIYLHAICKPEYSKQKTYKIDLVQHKDTNHIHEANCVCPAGKGPHGSCKHIATLCYALDTFCKTGEIPDYVTCTDREQVWNRPPKPKKIKPVPAQELQFKKLEYGKEVRSPLKPHSYAYDPRPQAYRGRDDAALKRMCDRLSQLPSTCCMLQLLSPVVDKSTSVRHDHTYAQTHRSPAPLLRHHVVTPTDLPDNVPQLPVKEEMKRFKDNLQLSLDQVNNIELQTRGQYTQPLWYKHRQHRITASKCGTILQRPTRGTVREILYSKPLIHLPPPIYWGRRKEKDARTLYEKQMRVKLGRKVDTQDCGLFVHPVHGWLAATPDAVVEIDGEQSGILEVKCPYTERDNTVENACLNPTFCCDINQGNLRLKVEHNYYHQVQLQLYVTGTKWCDFCVFMIKGIGIQRIYPDTLWQSTNIPKLEDFYDNMLLPEILYPKMKPSYIL